MEIIPREKLLFILTTNVIVYFQEIENEVRELSLEVTIVFNLFVAVYELNLLW